MDILSLFQLLARRKLVVIPMTVLVLVGLMVVYTTAPPLYRTSGSVVLLNPPSAPELPLGQAQPDDVNNPYIRFNDLSVVVDIVVRKMRSPAVDESLRRRGLTGTLVLGANLNFYNGPIIDVTVEAASRSEAISSTRLAMDEIGSQLGLLQQDQRTAQRYFVTTADVVDPERATAVLSGTIRRLIAAAALGAAAIIAVAILAEALAKRRQERKAARAGSPSEGRVTKRRRRDKKKDRAVVGAGEEDVDVIERDEGLDESELQPTSR